MRPTRRPALLFLPILAVAFAAAAVPAAQAQRLSLADRVALLEQRAANDQGNSDLLQQVTQQRVELQELRALIEQLQNEIEQLKQRNRDQYLDLDGRLNRLESGALPAPPLDPAQPSAATAPAGTPAAAAAARPAAAPAANPDRPPSVHGDLGALTQAGDERAAYNVAFDALKAGNYADSSQLFLSFLELHPNGVYAPNALYWLGESYYVTQNYTLATQQFRTLIERYPTHDKAPDALLKLGLSQFGEGHADQAERTLNDVITRFRGTAAARIASERLQSIRIGQLR